MLHRMSRSLLRCSSLQRRDFLTRPQGTEPLSARSFPWSKLEKSRISPACRPSIQGPLHRSPRSQSRAGLQSKWRRHMCPQFPLGASTACIPSMILFVS